MGWVPARHPQASAVGHLLPHPTHHTARLSPTPMLRCSPFLPKVLRHHGSGRAGCDCSFQAVWEGPEHPRAADTTWAALQRATAQSGHGERAAGAAPVWLSFQVGWLTASSETRRHSQLRETEVRGRVPTSLSPWLPLLLAAGPALALSLLSGNTQGHDGNEDNYQHGTTT